MSPEVRRTRNFGHPPTLGEMVDKGTMFILGAGSTFDDGFPLWKDLRNLMLLRMKKSAYFRDHPGKDYWWGALHENYDESISVDKLAAQANDDGLQFFRSITYDILVSFEKDDATSNNNGWIELFANKYIDLIKNNIDSRHIVVSCLQNIHFCTLNYDRCFAHRFGRIVNSQLERIYPNSEIAEYMFSGVARNYTQIHHPHGALGSLEKSNSSVPLKISAIHNRSINKSLTFKYGGGKSIFAPSISNKYDFIQPVDMLKYSNQNKSYDNVNKILKNVHYVILVGLSTDGIRNSFFEFGESSKIFTTGEEVVTNRAIPLGVHAYDLIESI